jgi:uncharacterized membrane protein
MTSSRSGTAIGLALLAVVAGVLGARISTPALHAASIALGVLLLVACGVLLAPAFRRSRD